MTGVRPRRPFTNFSDSITYFLTGLGTLGANPLVFSKPEVWTFVEIERSTHRLFTREGLIAEPLNRAIGQIKLVVDLVEGLPGVCRPCLP